MQKEIKQSYHCDNCNRQGIGYSLVSWDDILQKWQTDDSMIPEGWVEYDGGYILCERCSNDPEITACVKDCARDYRKKKKNKESGRQFAIIALFPGAIASFILPLIFRDGCISLQLILICLLCIALCIFCLRIALKRNIGCGVLALLIILSIPCLFLMGKNGNSSQTAQANNEVVNADSPSNESVSKTPTYLQGINDIESPTELRNFYYKIASDFHNNEMGLKGSSEQINAGNKIMSGVYGFLGTSISKGELLDVDSMKTIIQEDSIISDYRKKKALEELELGIRKISSIQ